MRRLGIPSAVLLSSGLLALSIAACGPPSATRSAISVAEAPAKPGPMESILPFWGHRSPVDALAFGPAGEVLYSSAPGEEVIAWNPHTGLPIRKYRGDIGDKITGLVIDPKARFVAVADRHKVTFWEPLSGNKLRSVELPPGERPGDKDEEITVVTGAGNPDFLLIGDNLGRLLVVDIEKGTSQKSYRTSLGPILSLASGNTWAVLSDKKTTMVIDLTRPSVPVPVLGVLDGLGIKDLAKFDDRVVGTDDENLLFWGPDFKDNARAIKSDGMGDLKVDEAMQRALSVNGSGGLDLWDLKKKKKLDTVYENTDIPWVVAIDPTGEFVASAEQNGIAIRKIDGGPIAFDLHNAIVPQFLMFEPGTHRFLTAGNDGRPVRYDLKRPTSIEPFVQMDGPIVDGALDVDANGFYASTTQGDVVVFDYAKGKIAHTLAPDVGPRPHIALGGSRIAQESERRGLVADGKGELVVWDLVKDDALGRLNVTDAIDVEFTAATSKVFYANKAASVESWSYDNQQRKQVYDSLNSKASRLRMAPGGTMMALCGDKGVSFFNLNLDILSGAKLPNAVEVAFAYDGTRAVAATADNGVYLIYFEGDQVRTEPVVTTPTPVMTLSISSDNRFLLVGESRGTVAIFDLSQKSTKPIGTLQILDDERWVTFDPKGSFVGVPRDEIRFDVQGEIVTAVGAGYEWKRASGEIYSIFR